MKLTAGVPLEGLSLARLVKKYAKEKKAEDIIILDLRELPAPSEFFLICTGNSEPQIKAIANEIETTLKQEHNIAPYSTTGRPVSQWMILDYTTLMVHIMHPDKRDYYNLESLWSDAKKIRR